MKAVIHPRITYELVLLATDNGDVHVVGGGGEIFELLASEDINGNDVNLGVTVLSGLGGGHLDDLAWATLDNDVTVLPQGRTLHGVGGRGTGIGALEGVFMLFDGSNCQYPSGLRLLRVVLRRQGFPSPADEDAGQSREEPCRRQCKRRAYLGVVGHGDGIEGFLG